MNKGIFIFTAVLVFSSAALAQDNITAPNFTHLQDESSPYRFSGKYYSDLIEEEWENERIQDEHAEQKKRQQKLLEHKQKIGQKQIEFDRFKFEREARALENRINAKFEKDKELHRIKYKDFDRVLKLGKMLIEQDPLYEEILTAHIHKDPDFDMAEYFYKIGKLHPHYQR